MGKQDSMNRVYFSNPERFADLVNGVCFGGEQILKKDDLTKWDSRTGSRTRDAVWHTSFGVGFAVIGEESQETVDYSLPFRILESDVGDYRKQVNEIKRENRKQINEIKQENRKQIKGEKSNKRVLTPGERLYCFWKDDKIEPVITIVLSNADVWDGPKSLIDMIDLENVPEKLRPFVSDYHLNLVEIPKLTEKDTEVFHTDLKQVLDLLRSYRDKNALKSLLQDHPEYETVEPEAYDLMSTYVNLDQYGIKRTDEEGGKINMKNGFDEIIEESQEIGRVQGKAEGKAEGEEIRLIRMVCKKLVKGKPISQIADELEEDISVINDICRAAERFKPEYDPEQIYEALHESVAV